MQGILIDGQCRKHGLYAVQPKKEDYEFSRKLLRELALAVDSKTTTEEKLAVRLSFGEIIDKVNERGRQEILFVHGKKKEHRFWLLDGRKHKKEIWKKGQLVSTKIYGENSPSVPKVEDNTQLVTVRENRTTENIFGLLFFVLLVALWGIKYFV